MSRLANSTALDLKETHHETLRLVPVSLPRKRMHWPRRPGLLSRGSPRPISSGPPHELRLRVWPLAANHPRHLPLRLKLVPHRLWDCNV